MGLCESKPIPEGLLRLAISRAAPNLPHLLISQPARPMPRFLRHVLSVVRIRAEEEMVGPHAGPNIAPMADKHSRWDGAVGYLPRDTMRTRLLLVGARAVGDLAVPVLEGVPNPEPAAV